MYKNILFALLSSVITWLVTALGAATVLFFNNTGKKTLDRMLGLSSGVMVAASIWSLIIPALNISKTNFQKTFNVCLGIILGVILMLFSDKIINLLDRKNIVNSNNKNLYMLVTSITIHNIPEGLAIGVAFGACSKYATIPQMMSAIIVAMGIAIQNFPEGAAISLPLFNYGLSKRKSFLVGQFSAIVEPIFAVIGAYLVVYITKILPICLSFAAGCMIFVVVDELLPSIIENNKRSAALFFILGFMIMMILDVVL
ncbi:MAG: ZIP family metal transporter [Clostridia bacterium]|nr:ZIP family metal transporter [Clostridia bacterium]